MSTSREAQRRSTVGQSLVLDSETVPGATVANADVLTSDKFIDETDAVIQEYHTHSPQLQTHHSNEPGVTIHGDDDVSITSPTTTQSQTVVIPGTSYGDVPDGFSFTNPPSIFGLPLAANVFNFSDLGVIEPQHQWDERSTQYNPGHDQEQTSSSDSGANLSSALNAQPIWLGQHTETATRNEDRAAGHAQSTAHGATAATGGPHPNLQPREAHLLKFFTQTWGPIFDCMDYERHFSNNVLQVALTKFAPLIDAMMAISALQLSRVSDYPFAAAEYYRSRCSSALVPLLLSHDRTAANEEALFATYVLLRGYAHMVDDLREKQAETLFTASLAFTADPSELSTKEEALKCASFWVHLRQDIHVALFLQCPIRTDYSPYLRKDDILLNLENSAGQAALDCAWGNRMVGLLCDVINYCFQQGPRTFDTWTELWINVERWSWERPQSFKPFCERERDPSQKRIFPEIWLTSDCHGNFHSIGSIGAQS
ncbi:hypothetical protein NA57DRAFT_60925 [Rhizodiscina lignyota]|uniref:Transcription factor domain-containing protein n=1 Tax=Rhizodiscina lignyota TaxID=1504668 RepID=A0A9P4I3G8_9PEZI|nr:hypothetical protein NA57DRAFT_60925 [Rhizodiscina lignyota]